MSFSTRQSKRVLRSFERDGTGVERRVEQLRYHSHVRILAHLGHLELERAPLRASLSLASQKICSQNLLVLIVMESFEAVEGDFDVAEIGNKSRGRLGGAFHLRHELSVSKEGALESYEPTESISKVEYKRFGTLIDSVSSLP